MISFQLLPPFLYEKVLGTPLKNPKVIHTTSLHEKLYPELSPEELKLFLNSESNLKNQDRIATRYAGHQFGVWAGQLGDGRALTIDEIILGQERFEIQTKGSGLTPFSRMGDGKAVIRSSVREYLCSIAMRGLGIPTTDVLSLMTGEDPVYRESVEKSALVTRVMASNIRFGHFELCFHFKKDPELKALIDYTQKNFYPDLSIKEMLQEIIKRMAHLIAHWQDVGFCHGVMNTDNMSILGLTIDYGPFGFLEDTDLNHICNHSDHQGRYAYKEQPSIGMWNLERLMVCFMNIIPKEELQEILNEYPRVFETKYLDLGRKKLGLEISEDKDFELMINLLQTLHSLKLDYTHFFRLLCSYDIGQENYFGDFPEIKAWLKTYDERLGREVLTHEERKILMKKNNPKFVLRNYIAQEVITDVERGNSEKLNSWIHILSNPFDEHPEFEAYAGPTPMKHKNHIVSCSS